MCAYPHLSFMLTVWSKTSGVGSSDESCQYKGNHISRKLDVCRVGNGDGKDF